jgi:hypothetical protein
MRTPSEQYDQLVREEESVHYQYDEPKMFKIDLVVVSKMIKYFKDKFKKEKVT